MEILPLSDPDVRRWREKALGPAAPWASTLIRVDATGVRAWTGPRMAIRLARRLGARSSAAVVRALGELRQEATAPPLPRQGSGETLGRRRLFQLGAGAAVVGGLIITGATPAFAEKRCATAAAWVANNRDKLPQTYDEIVTYPMAYRKAIFGALPAEVKSRLWVEQFERRQKEGRLSEQQDAVLRSAIQLAQPSMFERANAGAGPEVGTFRNSAVGGFGLAAAGAIFATLGPSDEPDVPHSVTPHDDCNCCYEYDLCSEGKCYLAGGAGCNESEYGCGPLWSQPCDGLCQ